MHGNQSPGRTCAFGTAIAVCLLAGSFQTLWAGEAILKNGLQIKGKPVPIQALTQRLAEKKAGRIQTYPILMVDTGLVRYFVPDNSVDDKNPCRNADVDRCPVTDNGTGGSDTDESPQGSIQSQSEVRFSKLYPGCQHGR